MNPPRLSASFAVLTHGLTAQPSLRQQSFYNIILIPIIGKMDLLLCHLPCVYIIVNNTMKINKFSRHSKVKLTQNTIHKKTQP